MKDSIFIQKEGKGISQQNMQFHVINRYPDAAGRKNIKKEIEDRLFAVFTKYV